MQRLVGGSHGGVRVAMPQSLRGVPERADGVDVADGTVRSALAVLPRQVGQPRDGRDLADR
jgi:hypothetical protein